MNSDRDERIEKLFAAARSEKYEVPFADEYFETRLMARIRERRDVPSPWYAAAWRMLPGFAVVTMMIVAGTLALSSYRPGDMFSAITTGQDEVVAISYLSGEK
jgi:hypothetical protein